MRVKVIRIFVCIRTRNADLFHMRVFNAKNVGTFAKKSTV